MESVDFVFEGIICRQHVTLLYSRIGQKLPRCNFDENIGSITEELVFKESEFKLPTYCTIMTCSKGSGVYIREQKKEGRSAH